MSWSHRKIIAGFICIHFNALITKCPTKDLQFLKMIQRKFSDRNNSAVTTLNTSLYHFLTMRIVLDERLRAYIIGACRHFQELISKLIHLGYVGEIGSIHFDRLFHLTLSMIKLGFFSFLNGSSGVKRCQFLFSSMSHYLVRTVQIYGISYILSPFNIFNVKQKLYNYSGYSHILV